MSVWAGRAMRRSRAQARHIAVTWLDAFALVGILALGLAHVHAPFGGDQFLFLVGAQKLAHHGVMYREFWDLKQPLIYYLYALAGRLFGFTEFGIHLFDALYQTFFAGVLIIACAARSSYRWTASLVPLLAVGAYEGFASNYALTSVEALAGLPIFVAAVGAADALAGKPGAPWRAIVAGVAAAAAAMLKLIFLPLACSLWLTALIVSRPRDIGHVVRTLALALAGCAVPLVLVACVFAQAGVLDVALRTALVDPPAILHQLAPADRSPFWPEARAFGRMMWPIIVLAIIGAAGTVRRGLDVRSAQMVVWVIAGCGLIALQVWSYEYRFFLITVPLGVLAADGCATLWTVVRGRDIRARAAFAAVMGVFVGASLLGVLRMQHNWPAWAAKNRDGVAFGVAYLSRPQARPGPIYVFGDPRMYYFSGRDQAVPINGWSPQLFLPAHWHALHVQLAAAAPPYIFVDDDYAPRVARSPELVAFLGSAYQRAATTSAGTWFERRYR